MKFGHEAEINIHRLETILLCIHGYVREQCSKGRIARRKLRLLLPYLLNRKMRGQPANGRTFDIALDTRNLTGKPNLGPRFQSEVGREKGRAIEERVSVQAA